MLLNINANVIWTVVDLLILFLLMKKFLFGPVTAMLDQRAAAYEQKLAQAQEEIQRMQQQAARQIEADRRAMLAQTRREIARLSLLAASKVAQQRMDADNEFALVDDFLSEMEDAS